MIDLDELERFAAQFPSLLPVVAELRELRDENRRLRSVLSEIGDRPCLSEERCIGDCSNCMAADALRSLTEKDPTL